MNILFLVNYPEYFLLQFFSLLTAIEHLFTNKNDKIVGNKAKGRISEQEFQENKARQIFRKMNISYS